MRRVDDLRLSVAVDLGQDGVRAVLLLDAQKLGRDDVGGLVPGDADVFRLAASFGVTLAVRIPVDALQRVRDTVLRIDTLFVGVLQGSGKRVRLRLEHRAVARGDLPGTHALHVVLLIVVHRANTQDLAVFHVDGGGVRAQPESAESKRLVNCLDPV